MRHASAVWLPVVCRQRTQGVVLGSATCATTHTIVAGGHWLWWTRLQCTRWSTLIRLAATTQLLGKGRIRLDECHGQLKCRRTVHGVELMSGSSSYMELYEQRGPQSDFDPEMAMRRVRFASSTASRTASTLDLERAFGRAWTRSRRRPHTPSQARAPARAP